MVQKKTWHTATIRAMTAVFTRALVRGTAAYTAFNSLRKLGPGTRDGGIFDISVLLLEATTKSQYKGKIERKAKTDRAI
jgi:hypothetical protein